MKRIGKEDQRASTRYGSTDIPPAVRTAFGSLGAAWVDRGWSITGFNDFLGEAGYTIPLSTTRGWVAAVRRSGSAVSENYGQGRPTSLTEEQTRLLVGFVCDKNSKYEEVHISTAQSFITTQLGVELSTSCVYTNLRQAGFSSRVAKTCSSGFKLDTRSLCFIAEQWLDEHRASGLLDTPRNRLCSIDFTFTGHRTDRRTTFSPSGEAQPKSSTSISRFTNCIITCLWADGVNRTPSVLFTYNQQFREDRRTTSRRLSQKDHLMANHNVREKHFPYHTE